jgi:hypothetical protein
MSVVTCFFYTTINNDSIARTLRSRKYPLGPIFDVALNVRFTSIDLCVFLTMRALDEK